MYLIDANIILEVLYKRDRWRECSDFLAMVKRGIIKAYILHFTLQLKAPPFRAGMVMVY
jgi:predicted nucleic acid-binding protein